MTRLVYVDSSVALAVAFREPGSQDLVARFDALRSDGFEAVSCSLLRAEVRRAFYRNSESFEGADQAVAWINLVDLDNEIVIRAGELAAHAKTLDAIHIAAAQALIDPATTLRMWTLDDQMRRAALSLGLVTLDPADR